MNMEYKETIKERIKILPESLKLFVLDENWRREAEKIGGQFNLDEVKYASLENEIFLTLLCFEPRTDFGENIKTELGIEDAVANLIAAEVEKNIFNQVAGDLRAIDQGIKENDGDTIPKTNIGQSFEQVILNQAKAMQPAAEAPVNLPTGEQKEEEKVEENPKVVHNYSGNDPYREPKE
jgi:hypothetical protein